MRRVTAGIWGSSAIEDTVALLVTAISFALGSLLGCLFVARTDGSGIQALEEYLTSFLNASGQGTLCWPKLPDVLWRTFRWPIGVTLLGFTTLGLAGIPVLSAIRGLLLTFSIGAFVRIYGWTGIRIAFYLLGITGLISVPIFLFLATQSFRSSLHLIFPVLERGEGETPRHSGNRFLSWILCAAALSACIFLEWYLIPLWIISASPGS